MGGDGDEEGEMNPQFMVPGAVCRYGHFLSPDNVYAVKGKSRVLCKECQHVRNRRHRAELQRIREEVKLLGMLEDGKRRA